MSYAVDAPQWLSGDDIVRLANVHNPDGPNSHPMWLKGPAPMSYFHTFFSQTVANPAMHGVVHIMVVNTGTTTGEHWFCVAWRINPTAPASAAQPSP